MHIQAPCVLLHHTVWSNHIAVVCHMALYTLAVLNDNRERHGGGTEVGHFSGTARAINTLTRLLGKQQVFQECIIRNPVTFSRELLSSGTQHIYTVHQTLLFFVLVGVACETRNSPTLTLGVHCAPNKTSYTQPENLCTLPH